MHSTVQAAGMPLVPPPAPPPIVWHPRIQDPAPDLAGAAGGAAAAASGGGGGGGGSYNGPQGSGDVKAQLKSGFNSIGRGDLAGMVDSPEFSTWVNQESGWDPNSISAANNQGKPNFGLFQFWAGHSWAHPGMSVEDQARAAAQQFNLTPDRIRGFANEIHGGHYVGWG